MDGGEKGASAPGQVEARLLARRRRLGELALAVDEWRSSAHVPDAPPPGSPATKPRDLAGGKAALGALESRPRSDSTRSLADLFFQLRAEPEDTARPRVASVPASSRPRADSNPDSAAVVAGLEKRNGVLSEQLRELEEVSMRMRDEIKALRQLASEGKGEGSDVKAQAAMLVQQLAEVTKERDEMKSHWAELTVLYRDKITDEFGAKDVDLGQVIEEHHLQAKELELYETMLTEAVTELNQLRAVHSRGTSNRQALEGHLEDVEQAHTQQSEAYHALQIKSTEHEKQLKSAQRQLKIVTVKCREAEEQLEKKSTLATTLKREVQSLSRRVADHKALLSELDSNHQKSISRQSELVAKLAEETAAKETAEKRVDELVQEKEEHERHYMESIEAFEAAARSAAGEMEREHERSKLHLEELLSEGSEQQKVSAELQAELMTLQADYAVAQESIDAASKELRESIISYESSGQAPWEPNAAAAEIFGLDLCQLVERFKQCVSAPPRKPEFDEEEIAALRARLAERENLLERVMKYMRDNEIDLSAEGGEGVVGTNKNGLSGILSDYDEDMQQLVSDNDRLLAETVRLRGEVARLTSGDRTVDDEPVAVAHPSRATASVPTRDQKGVNESFDLPPEVGKKLDDLGMSELLKDLADSENDRETLLKLVEELLSRIAELEQRVRDLEDTNAAMESRTKELEWCEGEYKLATKNMSKLISLQKQDSVLRTTLEGANEELRKANLDLTQQIAATASTKKGDEDAGSYPELFSQLERLQKDYDDAMSRLRKLLEWTRLQARRTWQDDGAANNCNACDRQFTFLLRRHHCRICGKVFCRYCSFCRVQTTLQKKPVRACTPCYEYVHKTAHDNDSTGCVELRVVIDRGPAMMPLEFLYSSTTNETFGGTEVVIDAVESGARLSISSADDSMVDEKLMAGDRILCVNGVNVSSVPPEEVPELFESALLKIDIERPPDPAQKLEAATNRLEQLMALERGDRSGSSVSPNDIDYDVASDFEDDDLFKSGRESELQSTESGAPFLSPDSWAPEPDGDRPREGVIDEESYIDIEPDSPVPVAVTKKGIEPEDIGRRVSVDGYPCSGYLRFVGAHKITGEKRCGVELDKPVGKNNGTVSGHSYFKCAKSHGVLCNPAKVNFIYAESGL